MRFPQENTTSGNRGTTLGGVVLFELILKLIFFVVANIHQQHKMPAASCDLYSSFKASEYLQRRLYVGRFTS